MSDREYEIGDDPEEMELVHELCGVVPRGTFYPWGQEYYGADGRTHGDGAARATWSFGLLPQGGVQALRELCSGKSAAVYIKTRTDEEDAFKVFAAIMHWPGDAMSRRTMLGYYRDFTVEFTGLEEIVP